MGRISTSWDLMGQSFRILRADKELLWLPILSAIFSVFVTTQVFFWSVLLNPEIVVALQSGAQWHPSANFLFTVSFFYYVMNYFVITYFNTALVGAAMIRLKGGDPTVEDGLRIAWQRKGVILQWALLAAIVGTVLRTIEQRVSLIGRFVVGLIGLAWSLASFLVVPVLTYENLGPIEALRRSGELFRKTWGEQVSGGLSFSLIFFFIALPGLILPFAGLAIAGQWGLIVGGALCMIYIVLLSVVSSATHGVFVAALYRYAADGVVPPGFYQVDFRKAWEPKTRNSWS